MSGGWDNTVVLHDIRAMGPIQVLYGPHVVGDSLDFLQEDILLAGSFDQEKPLSLWNMRTASFMDDISWTGEEESSFSQHESPKVNAARLIMKDSHHNEWQYLMAGGDTQEF